MCNLTFTGVKRPECGIEHPPPSSAEVKETVELYLYSPVWALVACSTMNFTLLISVYCVPREMHYWIRS